MKSDSFKTEGQYSVIFCTNGMPNTVKVDDNFYTKNEKEFIYCSCDSSNKLWMPLIEKAWAKSHGGYEKIDRGRSSECLRDLTGAPAFTFNIDDEKNDIASLVQ